MMRDNKTNDMPAQTSPGQTRSASGAGEPEHLDEKWATGTKRRWARCDNMALLECYYSSNPSQRGYMQRMWAKWLLRNPQSRLTAKQLVAQCSNIHKRQLLSQLEIDELQRRFNGEGPQAARSEEEVIQEIGRQAPMNADDEIGWPAPMNEMLSEAATDLKAKIMARMKAGQPRNRLQRLCEVPSESLIESVNAALRAIPTVTITETNELIYASASVILETLGYKSNHEIRYPPWKIRLEAKIKAARKDVSQLTEAQRGVMKRPIPERYIQMTITEALETAKQRLQALSSRLKRYMKENEARRINRLFATQPAKVYAQWQGPNNRADPPRLETERYWKGIWEKEVAHNSSAQWLVSLREEIYSSDIGMSFGLEKCSRMVTKRGRVVRTEGVSLPEGTIADIEDSYKYLGIPQANGNLELATRKAATAKYLQRVRQVLRSQLNGKNKTRAINSYALPVIRYPAGIIRWPKEEIQSTDVKTRKLLTMHGGFHPKSSTLRLYASRKDGGRGLVSVRATVQDETSKLHEYIKEKAPTDDVLRECLRQWGTEDEALEEGPSWEDKPLHGMYHRTITEVADLKKSYQWLERTGLKDSTEALILAAQEQALSTRAIEAQIYHTRQDPRCRLCKEAPETIQHITAGCKMLAGKAYMERHNQVAGIVYRNICAEYGLETPRSKWETPPKVVENDRAKILWDFQIQTDKMVMANQPDIVIIDKGQRKAVVVDIAVPSDGNIRKKEHEKLEKYQGLREELERAWKVKVTVTPVVVGALGAVTPKLDEWLQQIPGTTSDISVQKCAVLGTARILRRTLKLPGLW
ncbi:uncharacterized protein LOC127607055 [Hippocampus zosterae]|uniref:uncharacterized protein LOC127607055 n=1 Tax=Hippocampus zosterae TaxID=109293 RepID=UPI00223E0D9A|nr:uncharacterized protein LOC127607055 [Hippocampus zosterae]